MRRRAVVLSYRLLALCVSRFPGREAPTSPLEMQEQLISSTSSSEDENDDYQLTINEHYAKAFQYRKEREELVKRARPYAFYSIVFHSL